MQAVRSFPFTGGCPFGITEEKFAWHVLQDTAAGFAAASALSHKAMPEEKYTTTAIIKANFIIAIERIPPYMLVMAAISVYPFSSAAYLPAR
jgi:hypothetical protein